MDSIANLLHTVTGVLTGGTLNMVLTTFTSIGGLDIIMRLVKTDKPASVLQVFRAGVAGLRHLLGALDELLGATDALIGKLVPQRLLNPPQPGASPGGLTSQPPSDQSSQR